MLFPNVFLPLHIFEERYRRLVTDALKKDRVIGMVLLRSGSEHKQVEKPPVFQIGCSGVMTHAEKLPDGRYNILLHGQEKFRILAEEKNLSYRLARVELITQSQVDHEALLKARGRLETVLTTTHFDHLRVRRDLVASLKDENLVNALSQHLEFEPVEKQALLEQQGPLARCESLIELLEMKAILSMHPEWSDTVH